MDEIAVDRRIADRAGRLRREIPTLLVPEALIAATALVPSLPLHTKNLRELPMSSWSAIAPALTPGPSGLLPLGGHGRMTRWRRVRG